MERKNKVHKKSVTDTVKLNRRINYTIIRILWDCVKHSFGVKKVKGNENNKDSFMGMFELSKPKLDKLTSKYAGNAFLISYSEKLQIKTGVPSEFFYGQRCLSITGFGKEKWEKYFKEKDEYQDYKNEARSKKTTEPTKPVSIKKHEQELRKYLKELEPDIQDTQKIEGQIEIYMLKYFIKYGEAYKNAYDIKIEKLSEELKTVDIDYFVNTRQRVLDDYVEVLSEHIECIKAVTAIRRYASKKNKHKDVGASESREINSINLDSLTKKE